MKTSVVKYEVVSDDGESGEGLVYKLVVQEADTLVGMKRGILRRRGQDYLKADDGKVIKEAGSSLAVTALTLVATVIYPDLLAATVSAEGLDLDMTFADFLGLSDQFVDAWEIAVYGLNAHWLPQDEDDDEPPGEAEKKGKSGNDSSEQT